MEKFQAEATFEVWTSPRDFRPQQETFREAWVSLYDVYLLSLHFVLWGRGHNCGLNKNGDFKVLVHLFLSQALKIPHPPSLSARVLPS